MLQSNNSSNAFKDDIDNKVKFLSSLVAWIISTMITIPLSAPGLVISIQYSGDVCVKGTSKINEALDIWLGLACGGIILATIGVLVFLCISTRKNTFKGFTILMFVIYIPFTTIGWYLFANSTLKCHHDSLWVMSLVYLCALSTAAICVNTWLILQFSCVRNSFSNRKCCGCWTRCINRCLDINEIENRFQYTNINTPI